ncbi:MAG: hypothetical protein M1823_003048 [Watsoniomyces obsoletus]|nr:MAG: hypothetical protein M1823_003048 [Watsoniomyces obsoletus]
MASALVPSTPTSQTPPALNSTPTTGSWQHPKIDEIARRQSQATFTDRNLTRILWNGGAFLGTWGLSWTAQQAPWISTLLSSVSDYAAWSLLLLRLYFLVNILLALAPVLRPKDELIDIPLTPTQRKLLGLDPSASPPTPAGAYVTPPRYPQSASPRSASGDRRGSPFSGSPLAGNRSPSFGSMGRNMRTSPNVSPLWQKTISDDIRVATRRSSYGSPSPLAQGSMMGMNISGISMPSTPSPPRGKLPGLGLNNKWLYERSRGSPLSARVLS